MVTEKCYFCEIIFKKGVGARKFNQRHPASPLGKSLENMVIVGCGHIAKALINHGDFTKEGGKIVAGFDLYPSDEKFANIPIYKTSIHSPYSLKTLSTVCLYCGVCNRSTFIPRSLIDGCIVVIILCCIS